MMLWISPPPAFNNTNSENNGSRGSSFLKQGQPFSAVLRQLARADYWPGVFPSHIVLYLQGANLQTGRRCSYAKSWPKEEAWEAEGDGEREKKHVVILKTSNN